MVRGGRGSEGDGELDTALNRISDPETSHIHNGALIR